MGGSFFLLSFFFTSFPLPPALFFYFRSIDIGLGQKKKKKRKPLQKISSAKKKFLRRRKNMSSPILRSSTTPRASKLAASGKIKGKDDLL